MPKYRLVNEIHDKRYPYTSVHYKGATMLTGKIMRQKYGDKIIDEMDKYVYKLPSDEMAGKLSKHGKIKVSKKIPIKYRKIVAEWEQIFFDLLTNPRKRIKLMLKI